MGEVVNLKLWKLNKKIDEIKEEFDKEENLQKTRKKSNDELINALGLKKGRK